MLYVSGEESARQIKLRAERIGKFTDDLYLFSETCIGTILQAVDEVKPEVLIVDSIQTVFEESVDAAPGSVSPVSYTHLDVYKRQSFGISVLAV